MAFVGLLPRQGYAAGIHTFGPFAIAANAYHLRLRLARHEKTGGGNVKANTRWDSVDDGEGNESRIVKAEVEISYNSGVDWQLLMRGGAYSGVTSRPAGRHGPADPEEEWARMAASLPGEGNASRQLRGTMEVLSLVASIQTKVEYELLTR